MELKIYNQTGDLKLTVSPNTSSTVTEEVMGECAVSVGFTHTEFVMLDVNDYIDIEGIRYRIMAQYRPKQKNTQTYEYSVKFYAPIHQAENTLMLFTPDNEMTSEFAYDGGPREHLQLWIDNMNRIAGTGVWKIGTVITAENKVIEYKNVKCWDAAFGSNGIAAAFNTEMWADGYYINLCKAERGERVDLGYLQGLTSLQQEENGEVKFFTRLFPLGSTRNIDASKYGHSRLQLPGGAQFVDKNVDIYGVKEEFEEEAFSEIYPKYIGTVQSVRTENLTNTEGRDYTVYYIKDAAIPFNPNDYEIAEFTKMIAFQNGELAGRGDEKGNFQANWHEDTKEWEIINTYPDDNTQIPGGLIVPKAGDTYIPWNFRMPDEYNTLAEQEYLEAVNDYLNEYSFDTNKYSGQTDRNHIENNNIKLMIGLNVRLQSDTYFAAGYKDTRITKVVRQLNDLYQATVTCTDKIGEGWKKSVDNSINSLRYEVAKSLEQTVIDVIKTGDNKTPSDNNVFSALKSLTTLLRKDKQDSTKFLIKFLGGLMSDNIESQNFASGAFGSGFLIKRDPATGKSYIEADEIYIRLKAYFDTLQIKHLSHVGGRIVLSPASMECTRVEEIGVNADALFDYDGEPLYDSNDERLYATSGVTRSVSVYRCYFKQSDDDKSIVNEFAIDDLAQCREFNVKSNLEQGVSNQYYWRRVVGVGTDYIDLSIDDCDAGSMIPKAGDTIVTIGNKTDKNRQHVVYLSSYDDDAPSIKLYSGINSYSMLNKEVTVISPNADKNVFTGKVVIKPGSEGFGNLTDAPDIDALKEDISTANTNAQNAIDAANSANDAVGDLNDYVDGSFSDGIISESEAKAIEKYINIVNGEKESSESKYNILYANPYLLGEAKTNLLNAKISFFGAIDNLISSINTAIEDGKTTTEEKADVDAKFALYNSAYSDFNKAIENANESIQDVLKSYSDEAERQAGEAALAASNAQTAANNAETAVSDLNTYVDGAFSDGIIEQSEAKSIEKYINTVNQTKEEVEATYTVLYANPYLTGTAKTALLNAKISFLGDVEDLIESINTAIEDGKTTAEEKEDVDNKFATFNTSYASLSTAIENANKAIQDKIKELAAQEAVESVSSEIESVSNEAKDDIARKLGYADFAAMVTAFEDEETIISGGHINTKLIQANLIVTTALIAAAIKTATLNVNDKFIVEKDGTFKGVEGVLERMNINGALRSPFSYDGFTGIIIGGVKKLVTNNIIVTNPSSGNLFSQLPGGEDYDGFSATIINYDSEEGKAVGSVQLQCPYPIWENAEQKTYTVLNAYEGIDIQGFSNGTDFVGWIVKNRFQLSQSTVETVTISTRTEPSNAGTVIGGGTKPIGYNGYIEAIANDGYIFIQWSDGVTNARRLVSWTEDKYYVAQFDEIPDTYYTLTLKVSPSGAGSTTGAGSYKAGEYASIKAIPNSGYVFNMWSDGDKNIQRDIIISSDKTLTAYFNEHTISSDNLLENVYPILKHSDEDAGNVIFFNKILIIGNKKQSTLSTVSFALTLNEGYLASKLKAGSTYRLSFNHYGGNGTDAAMIAIGDIGDTPSQIDTWELISDTPTEIFYIGTGDTSSPSAFSKDFTISRESSASDSIIITGVVSKNFYFSNIELKEI